MSPLSPQPHSSSWLSCPVSTAAAVQRQNSKPPESSLYSPTEETGPASTHDAHTSLFSCPSSTSHKASQVLSLSCRVTCLFWRGKLHINCSYEETVNIFQWQGQWLCVAVSTTSHQSRAWRDRGVTLLNVLLISFRILKLTCVCGNMCVSWTLSET